MHVTAICELAMNLTMVIARIVHGFRVDPHLVLVTGASLDLHDNE